MSEWVDRVAIITGAGSGIGEGIALEFARNGCAVTLVGRNESNLKETAIKCEEFGLSKEKVLYVVADLLKDEELDNIVKKTIDKFGKLNVLVNNAGVAKIGTIYSLNAKDFDIMMQTNIRSVVLLTQATLPYLEQTQGSIVNISSIAGLIGLPSMLGYSISKAAMDQFTRCCAINLAPKKVRINSVNPGLVVTNIHERMGLSKEETKEMLEKSKATHPMGRDATIDDVAQTVLFLASDKSSFTTGQTIAIDGGRPIIN